MKSLYVKPNVIFATCFYKTFYSTANIFYLYQVNYPLYDTNTVGQILNSQSEENDEEAKDLISLIILCEVHNVGKLPQ